MQQSWCSYLYRPFGSHFVFPRLDVRAALQRGASQSNGKPSGEGYFADRLMGGTDARPTRTLKALTGPVGSGL